MHNNVYSNTDVFDYVCPLPCRGTEGFALQNNWSMIVSRTVCTRLQSFVKRDEYVLQKTAYIYVFVK